MSCSQSAFLDDSVPAISVGGDAASLGSGVHELLADLVRTGEVPTIARRNEVAVKHSIADPSGDLHYLVWAGKEAWEELRGSFEPDPLVEVGLSGEIDADLVLTGHADVMRATETEVHGIDWKSGYKPTSYYHQVAGYALLMLLDNPRAQKAVMRLVWLRERTIETLVWTRAQAKQWLGELVAHLKSGVYRPGGNCRFCLRQGTCPARVQIVRATLSALTEKDFPPVAMTKEEWEALTPVFSQIWGRAALVLDVIDRFKSIVREGVEKFGPLPLTAETELQLVPVKPRKSLKTEQAWPVLETKLTDAELAEHVTVSLPGVQEAVAKKAARGLKKAAKEELLKELVEAGAVEEKAQNSRLTEKRKESQP